MGGIEGTEKKKRLKRRGEGKRRWMWERGIMKGRNRGEKTRNKKRKNKRRRRNRRQRKEKKRRGEGATGRNAERRRKKGNR